MKVLALDGGGVFGIGQAEILSHVNISKFDVFVGTSIGAVNASILAAGVLPPSMLPGFFETEMPKIFSGHWWRQYCLWTPRYDDAALNAALRKTLPGRLDSVKKPLFITTVNLDKQQLKVFSSKDLTDGAMPLWTVARAAVGAETYFLPRDGHADGGIFANNPSMVAISAVCRNLGVPIEEIELCSIGTGIKPIEKVGSTNKWTVLHWGKWVFEALLNGAANSMHEHFAKNLPIKKYTRVQFVRDAKWEMDNSDDMLKARSAWAADIQNGISVVNGF